MPTTVPNSPTNGRRWSTDGGQHSEAPLQFGVNDGLRALECAARTLDGRLSGSAARSAELLQASRHNLGQVRLLVAIGDLDRFFQLAVLQGASNFGSELTRLFARCREVQITVDHHGQRPDGLDEKKNGNRSGPTIPCVATAPRGLKLTVCSSCRKCQAVDRMRSEMCELSGESLESFL